MTVPATAGEVCERDANVSALASRLSPLYKAAHEKFGKLPWGAQFTAAIKLADDGSAFEVWLDGSKQGEVHWECIGEHNVNNGLMAIAAARHVGVAPADAAKALDTFINARRRLELRKLESMIRTSWFMVFVFWIGWLSGPLVALTLFGGVSFFALREFMTLSPTRLGDHRSLVLAFFVVLPLQYWLVATEHFDMFAVFIPVYVFLALPVASALANDPLRFLERNAKLQWGIMVCIYGMSHVPALLMLKFPGYDHRNAFMVFFLVLVVQICMVTQHFVSRKIPRPPIAPAISQSFNWRDRKSVV